jgi:thiamine-phosphate pyrophosphorylase
MKIIVISAETGIKSETVHVVEMFKNGLDVFHVRKPGFSESLFEEYIQHIPEKYHPQLVIHSYHHLITKYNLKGIHITKRHKKRWFKTAINIFKLKFKRKNFSISTSCHSLRNLNRYSNKYDYIMLSPVFDSISKSKQQAAFKSSSVKSILEKCKNNVFALGGVNVDKIDKAKSIGFAGVVLYGSIWQGNNSPVRAFLEIKNKIHFVDSLTFQLNVEPLTVKV